MTMVTLLIKPLEVWSREAERILAGAAETEATVKRLVANIENGYLRGPARSPVKQTTLQAGQTRATRGTAANSAKDNRPSVERRHNRPNTDGTGT